MRGERVGFWEDESGWDLDMVDAEGFGRMFWVDVDEDEGRG